MKNFIRRLLDDVDREMDRSMYRDHESFDDGKFRFHQGFIFGVLTTTFFFAIQGMYP